MFYNLSELKPGDVFMFPDGNYGIMTCFNQKVFPGIEVRSFVNELGFVVPAESNPEVMYCGTLSELGEIKNRPMEK